jgi:DNA mismatch repair ATPase MutS
LRSFCQFAERWRQQNREGLATWLDSLGQFEALLCFARYHYENPDHTFAILKPEPSALFQVEALGHPLIDRQICVRCDLRLDAQGTQPIMVSGSNMSGKSTLVRSVGENGEMQFDYKMRPGVLTHTNGLNVMAALGLLPGYLSDRVTPS